MLGNHLIYGKGAVVWDASGVGGSVKRSREKISGQAALISFFSSSNSHRGNCGFSVSFFPHFFLLDLGKLFPRLLLAGKKNFWRREKEGGKGGKSVCLLRSRCFQRPFMYMGGGGGRGHRGRKCRGKNSSTSVVQVRSGRWRKYYGKKFLLRSSISP